MIYRLYIDMSITYYEVLDYSQVKYTDNCICDIPMYDKNDLKDKRGIHSFKIFNDWSGLNRNITEEEDVWKLKDYYDAAYDLANNHTNSNVRATCTYVCERLAGERKITSTDTDFSKLYPRDGIPRDDFAYNSEGGVLIPSLGDGPGYIHYVQVSNVYKAYAYTASTIKLGFATSNTTVRTVVLPNPMRVLNPKTGIRYENLTFKVDYFYQNAHYILCNNFDENSTNNLATTVGKGYCTAKILGKNISNSFASLKIGTTNSMKRCSYELSTYYGMGTWHPITMTIHRNPGSDYGGYSTIYIGDFGTKNTVSLDSGTWYNCNGTKITNAGDYLNYYASRTNDYHLSLFAKHKDADTDKRFYNKNYIKKLQIFNGEDYEQIATEPMSFIKMNEDKKLYRVVTNNDELKKKKYRCYEYR